MVACGQEREKSKSSTVNRLNHRFQERPLATRSRASNPSSAQIPRAMPGERRCPARGGGADCPSSTSIPLSVPSLSSLQFAFVMTVQDELEYLKSLVAQLNDKIHTLEAKAKSAVTAPKTPAQQLRTILVGPPGAGEVCACMWSAGGGSEGVCVDMQGRERRHRASGMNSVYAISRPATYSATRSRARPSSVLRPRRLWMLEVLSAMTLSLA